MNGFLTDSSGISHEGPPKMEWKYLLYGFIIFSQLATWGIVLYQKNKSSSFHSEQSRYSKRLDSMKNEVQKLFHHSEELMESKTSLCSEKDSLLNQKDNEILKLRNKIKIILQKEHLSKQELIKTKKLILEMNEKVLLCIQENEQLKKTNQELLSEKEGLSLSNASIRNEMDTLKRAAAGMAEINTALKKINELAEVLNCSGAQLRGYHLKNNGKEQASTRSSKINRLTTTFDITAGRAFSGKEQELFFVITGPEGPIVPSTDTLGVSFIKSNGQRQMANAVLHVSCTPGEKKSLKQDFPAGKTLTAGKYHIEIYHKGYLIGEAALTLN